MICRVCLKESQCSLQIFDVNGIQLGIADILQRHFWFQPERDDSISNVICRVCWIKVNDFHQFYLSVEQAHFKFNQRIEANDDNIAHKNITETMENEMVLCEVNIKEELMDSLYAEDVRMTERGPEPQNPLLETESADVSGEDLNMKDEKLEAIKIEEHAEAAGAEEALDKPESRTQKRKYVRKKGPAPKISDTNDDEDGDSDNEVEPNKPKRLAMISDQDDEIVKKHIPMGCNLCAFVAEDFAGMSKHFRIQHKSIKPYIMCCNKKLNKRFKVVQHAYKHEDPEFFKCHDCQKAFSDRYTLRSHMVAAHAPEELLTFSCDLCPKKFPKKYLLELHKPSHVPMDERAFICDQCPNGKARFASNHLLKIHISMRHRRATNVCHVCAKEIRDKQAFEKHVRLHFEDSGPRVKCPRPDCDRWLKDEENLRQHMRRHNDEGRVFACTECSRVCKNRRALTSHMHYVHSNEVFTCEECNKSFKKAITLREHMAQHTGESLYKCPFCTRTFNSNANMHSHKKKMHPIEWDNWRKTKQGSSQKIITKQHGLQIATNSFSADDYGADAEQF